MIAQQFALIGMANIITRQNISKYVCVSSITESLLYHTPSLIRRGGREGTVRNLTQWFRHQSAIELLVIDNIGPSFKQRHFVKPKRIKVKLHFAGGGALLFLVQRRFESTNYDVGWDDGGRVGARWLDNDGWMG